MIMKVVTSSRKGRCVAFEAAMLATSRFSLSDIATDVHTRSRYGKGVSRGSRRRRTVMQLGAK